MAKLEDDNILRRIKSKTGEKSISEIEYRYLLTPVNRECGSASMSINRKVHFYTMCRPKKS